MHFDHQPHAPLREFVERTEKRHGGVVDQNVRRTNAFDHLGEESLPVFAFGQVSLDCDRRAAGAANLLERLPKRSGVFGIGLDGARGEPDHGAFGGQPLGDRLPQSAASARHESDLAGTGSRHFRPASRCIVARENAFSWRENPVTRLLGV